MAKLDEASMDVETLFNEVRNNTTIPQWVEFKVYCNNKQKKDVCKVIKSNDLVEKLSEGVNFAVIINESIFDELPVDLQKTVIDEQLAGVQVSELDVVSYEKPDFNTYTGVLSKYGDNAVIVLKESIKSLYEKKKQEEDAAKAATKGKRGAKK